VLLACAEVLIRRRTLYFVIYRYPRSRKILAIFLLQTLQSYYTSGDRTRVLRFHIRLLLFSSIFYRRVAQSLTATN